jgi:O-antigen/teichoic acid export membrane protein
LNTRLLSSSGRSEAAYFVIFNLTNVLNYAYLVFVGFFLGADSYGLFGALFGVVYLASALGNMVKMAVARHVATVRARNGGAVTGRIVTSGLVWAALFSALVGLLLVPAVPLLAHTFDSPTAPVIWAALAIVLSIWVPASHGVLQGMERFPSLGASLFVAAIVRIAAGGMLVAAGAGVSGALAGVVIGFAGSALFALARCYSCVRDRTDGEAWIRVPAPRIASLVGVLVASIVTAAPTSLDVAVVRNVFSGDEAGVFTGIAVLGRVIIFGAIAVPFTVLPKVAARTASGTDTGKLLLESLTLTGGLAVAGATAIIFAVDVLGWQLVGTDVGAAGVALHWYLAAMVAFSLTVTLIYYQVGRGDSAFILLVGAPYVVLQGFVVALIPETLTGVAQALFVVNTAALATSLVFASGWLSRTARVRRHPGATIQSEEAIALRGRRAA